MNQETLESFIFKLAKTSLCMLEKLSISFWLSLLLLNSVVGKYNCKSVILYVNQYLLDMMYWLKMTDNESQLDCLEYAFLFKKKKKRCQSV